MAAPLHSKPDNSENVKRVGPAEPGSGHHHVLILQGVPLPSCFKAAFSIPMGRRFFFGDASGFLCFLGACMFSFKLQIKLNAMALQIGIFFYLS